MKYVLEEIAFEVSTRTIFNPRGFYFLLWHMSEYRYLSSKITWASEAFEKGGDLSREVWHNKSLWYKNDKKCKGWKSKAIIEESGSIPSRKFWIFTLILMRFGRFWGHLQYIFTLMGCQRGVTRHPDNPPFWRLWCSQDVEGGGASCKLLGVHMHSLNIYVSTCLSSCLQSNLLIINGELYKSTQNFEY